MSDNYVLAFLSGIKQAENWEKINADIRQLEKTINMLRLTATLARGNIEDKICYSLPKNRRIISRANRNHEFSMYDVG